MHERSFSLYSHLLVGNSFDKLSPTRLPSEWIDNWQVYTRSDAYAIIHHIVSSRNSLIRNYMVCLSLETGQLSYHGGQLIEYFLHNNTNDTRFIGVNTKSVIVACTDTGGDSPPEPAPPEVPPRGPSLHATHTLRAQQVRNGCPPNATAGYALPPEQVQSENYQGKF